MSNTAVPLAPAPASSPGRHILLVEDNVINQEIARAVLESAGHRVDVVADGSEAVAAVQSRDYDVVLMDIQMPVMDGVTATRRIRALDHPAHAVPIIAMTASVLPQQVTSFFDAGMNGHVAKPFKREELNSAIARWAAQGAPEAKTAPSPEPTLDRSTFESILSLLGPEKTDLLLDRLAQQLRRFETSARDAGSRDAIVQDAHSMISAAGLLGFARLSGLCREIEEQCLGGADPALVLRRMAEMRPGILAEIEAVRAGTGARPGH
jgi:CheY-like chemotaxis protein/HPt (histidine-containing phosphotransfer) domain-containing protein